MKRTHLVFIATLLYVNILSVSSQLIASNLSVIEPGSSSPPSLLHFAPLFNPLLYQLQQQYQIHLPGNKMLLSEAPRLHRGEREMRDRMRVPFEGDTSASSPFLTPQATFMLQRAPLLALGALDAEGRPWTTLWGNENPFAQVLAQNVVGVRARVDAEHDPVVQALMRGAEGGKGTVRLVDMDGSAAGAPGGDDGALNEVRRVGGLTLDLETRKRVKLAGRMMVGDLSKGEGQGMDMTLVARIEESLGNCPKYLNKKHIVAAETTPKLISDSVQMCPEAISLLEKADLFFVSSVHEESSMDTNHRGGPKGFTRLVSNDADGAVLVWPEYSGNRLYQTLGNFVTTPLAGLVFPDFETGDVLYVTGVPEILLGTDAAAVLPRSTLAVKLKITAARFVQAGLPFRGQPGEPSPYNPGVRFASTEKVMPGTQLDQAVEKSKQAVARLVSRDDLTPTISRFRFVIENTGSGSGSSGWKPGQYATLSFADELDVGYSHMRDDDPRSLNDDWVRTFTVSSAPSKKSLESSGPPDPEFELTVRKVGNATTHLFRQNVRSGFELPLLGFEGEFQFPGVGVAVDGADSSPIPIIAAGIGITPVLGQLGHIDASRLRLLWTVNVADIGLVADSFKRSPQDLKAATVAVFVTGDEPDAEKHPDLAKALASVRETGVRVERRRLAKEDVDMLESEVVEKAGSKGEETPWFMCVGPGLKKEALGWLEGKRVVYEDFNY